MKTGRLTAREVGRHDHEHYGCVDCGTLFPVLIDWDNGVGAVGQSWNEVRAIKCNGHAITVCPWCRPDSKPWENGRGM